MMKQQQNGKKIETAIRKNEIAMVSFANAFTTEGLIKIIYSSCSDEWPEGLAHLVVQELLRKY